MVKHIRKIIQGAWGLLTNGYLKGFLPGGPALYTGPLKKFCVPGMNCYSCPGALGACPIGALQSFFTARNRSFPFYVLGYLAAVGVIAGRFICGWLCLFGLIQELLYKIPTPKLKLSGRPDRVLRNLKYLVLAVLVVALFSIGFADTIQVPLGVLIHDEAGAEINASLFENVSLGVQFISLCAIGPACEELIFRGLVYRRTRDYLGVWWAVLLSSIIFGVYHQNLTQGVFAFFFGIVLAAVYEHYGTIWAAIAAHAANNLYAVVLNALLERELVSDTGYLFMLVISAAAAISLGFYIFKFDQKKNVI